MTNASTTKKKMLTLATATGAILIALTLYVAFGFDSVSNTGLVGYMMAVPIVMTVLSFAFGYKDINDDLSDEEVAYFAHRSYIFGGLIFVLSIIIILAMMLR